MSEKTSHFKVEKSSARNFGLVFAAVFLIVAIAPYVFSGRVYVWAFALAAVFGGAALIRPGLLEPLNAAWFRFGLLLGAVVAPVVMMLVYFLVVTPTGWLMKAFGKDPLRLKRNEEKNTYWIDRTAGDEPSASMKNQF